VILDRGLPMIIQRSLLSEMDSVQVVEQSKNVAKPPQNAKHDDGIENRLDRAGHGNELINHPKDYPDHNQCEQYLN
jgi:hypothetical protein